jgi:hypothetical protein
MALSAQLHSAIMGPEAAIALAALATTISGFGVKALFQIAKGLAALKQGSPYGWSILKSGLRILKKQPMSMTNG